MLTINRKTDYAARILLHLAMQPPGTTVTVQEAAQARLVPYPLARRLFSLLANAGFLKTHRGKGGGFSLARSPAEISLLEVVEAVEGPVALNRCTVEPQECPLVSDCPVHEEWVKARDVLRDYLGRVSFQQLAERAIQPRNHPDPRGGAQ